MIEDSPGCGCCPMDIICFAEGVMGNFSQKEKMGGNSLVDGVKVSLLRWGDVQREVNYYEVDIHIREGGPGVWFVLFFKPSVYFIIEM